MKFYIIDNESLYTEIIEPLGYKAKERNEEFMVAYAQIINKFTLDFMKEFCIDGKVDWEKLVKFNSGKKQFTCQSHNDTGKTIIVREVSVKT